MSREPATPDAAPSTGAADREVALVAAILAGDEAAFLALLTRYQAALVRLAHGYISDPRAAEAVVQTTWMAVLQGLPERDNQTPLKLWIFRILVQQVQRCGPTAAGPGARTQAAASAVEPCVDPRRFRPAGAPWAGGWASPPPSWDAIPPEQLQAPATRAVLEQAIAALPPGPRAVIILRDAEGWSADEVGVVLGLGTAQQRRLLNYARAQVRSAVARYLTGEGGAA